MSAKSNTSSSSSSSNTTTTTTNNNNNTNTTSAIVHNPETCSQPLDPRPHIRELLRTRYAAPGIVLLVEGVDTALTSGTGRWRTIRVLLSDGELCVQGLLAFGLHRYVDTGEVAVGTYVRLDRYTLEYRTLAAAAGGGGSGRVGGDARVTKTPRHDKQKADRKSSGKMVCLIVDSLVPVGWNRDMIALAEDARQAAAAAAEAAGDTAKSGNEKLGIGNEAQQLQSDEQRVDAEKYQDQEDDDKKSRPTSAVAGEHATARESLVDMDMDMDYYYEDGLDDGDDDDDFEVMPISQARSSQRRQEVATPARNTATSIMSKQQQHHGRTGSIPPQPQFQLQPPQSPQPAPAPATTATIPKPLKLTPLKSIPTLPYRQNWAVNVLAVVSSISDVEPSGLKPPPYSSTPAAAAAAITHHHPTRGKGTGSTSTSTSTQRRVRLTDPSTSKHVLLTVFLDPEQFCPAVGSVVLLLGVKNHMFDGGSLKKYASDRPRGALAGRGRGGTGMGGGGGGGGAGASGYLDNTNSWWFENPVHFPWCDVDGLKRWWWESQHQAEKEI